MPLIDGQDQSTPSLPKRIVMLILAAALDLAGFILASFASFAIAAALVPETLLSENTDEPAILFILQAAVMFSPLALVPFVQLRSWKRLGGTIGWVLVRHVLHRPV